MSGFPAPPLASRLPGVGTSVFSVVSQLAQAHGALNLGQGFPDYNPPPALQQKLTEAMATGRNQYPPSAGLPALREAIARHAARLHGVDVDPANEITVTVGATEALFCAIQACVQPGDEVIVLDPAYDLYWPVAELAGARIVRVPLAPVTFGVDWQRLAEAIGPKTRLVVFNNPHNPSGRVWTAADLQQLASLLRGSNACVVADEVYESLVFDGRRPLSALTVPELRARTFATYSFGKMFDATGWRAGYCIAPPTLTAEFRKVHQYVTFAVFHPLQAALASYLDEAPEHGAALAAFYQARRDRFLALLDGTRLRSVPSEATYFQLVDYSAVSDLPDAEFARELILSHGVAAIPLSAFGRLPREDRLLRFCFAKHDATLVAAAERLARL